MWPRFIFSFFSLNGGRRHCSHSNAGARHILAAAENIRQRIMNDPNYSDISARYVTHAKCPGAVRSARLNLIIRTGFIFLTIWPPTEPA